MKPISFTLLTGLTLLLGMLPGAALFVKDTSSKYGPLTIGVSFLAILLIAILNRKHIIARASSKKINSKFHTGLICLGFILPFAISIIIVGAAVGVLSDDNTLLTIKILTICYLVTIVLYSLSYNLLNTAKETGKPN